MVYFQHLFRLQKLRSFSASDNEIQEIPQDIGNWQLLQELDLSKNGESFYELANNLSQSYSLEWAQFVIEILFMKIQAQSVQVGDIQVYHTMSSQS